MHLNTTAAKDAILMYFVVVLRDIRRAFGFIQCRRFAYVQITVLNIYIWRIHAN